MKIGNVKWFVCGGPDWYRPSVTSTRQIARQFQRHGYRVLWVNPIPFKSAAVNSVSRKSYWSKVRSKLTTHLKVYRRVEPGIHVFVPLYVPIFRPFWSKLNRLGIQLQLYAVQAVLGIKRSDAVLWLSGGFTLAPLLKRGFYKSAYQAADLISAFRTDNEELRDQLRTSERELCQNVDVIFASSPAIRRKLEALSGREVRLLLHGVDAEHFRRRGEPPARMATIRGANRRVAGYFGSLSDANDQAAYLALAEHGFSVVLIGRVLGDYTALEKHEHVHFLGAVPYEDLPAYARCFDVCIMAWKPGEWIENCFPIKTLEYLAMGKPIVTCPIPIVQELFGHLVYVAERADDFPLQAKRALAEDSPEGEQLRIGAAADCSWAKRFEEVSHALYDAKS